MEFIIEKILHIFLDLFRSDLQLYIIRKTVFKIFVLKFCLFNRVSLSMQATLLKDLLKLVIPEYADVSTHYNVEFSTLNSEALFAVFLYHRWVINSFVNSMLACKSKTNNLT